MWSKNLQNIYKLNNSIKVNKKFFHWSPTLSSSQIQEARQHVKEYKDTPKPAKVRVLKKFRDPFPKSFFIGKCDPEVLEYPEVLTLSEIESINNVASNVRLSINEEILKKYIDNEASISKDIVKKLSELQLFATKFPIQYHGEGLTETDSAVIKEAAGLDASIYKLIIEQQDLSGALINTYGSEEQKLSYLVPLIYGEKIIACAYQEKKSLADCGLETVAVPSGNDEYEIRGKKVWVYNASVADAFIVFANTVSKDEKTDVRSQTLSAFIVPTDSPGLTIHPPVNKLGARAVPACQVDLDKVKVPFRNILGPLHSGEKMLNTLGGKLDISAAVLAVTKHIFNDVTKYVINTNFLSTPMQEMDAVKSRLGKMATAIYGLESALYLNTGHIDLYENADSFLGFCILKVIAAETLQYVLWECIQLLGADGHAANGMQYLERYLRDSTLYYACDETNMNLKAAIALSGLQHAGMTMHEEIKKVRNPLMFPAFILKKIVEGNKKFGGEKGNNLGLAGYLHPSLQNSSAILEFCISRVHMATEILLSKHGKEVLTKHTDLEALADIAISSYLLTAVLGRASRSYCIGLSECDVEMEMALATSNNCKRTVKTMIRFLQDGTQNNTTRYRNIAERVLINKGWFNESPIARNF